MTDTPETPEGDQNNPQRKGGLVRSQRLDAGRKAEIGRLGAEARWGSKNLPTATDEGILNIGELNFPAPFLTLNSAFDAERRHEGPWPGPPSQGAPVLRW